MKRKEIKIRKVKKKERKVDEEKKCIQMRRKEGKEKEDEALPVYVG